MNTMTPRQIVEELDKYIIGQDEAKRAVAIALRNRYRRSRLDPEIREDITPKNILMVGPTGVGKTEIARRLAKLVDAPLVKVEATKFTEVGYVGRDVDSMVRDLVETSLRLVKERMGKDVEAAAEQNAQERILDALIAKEKGEKKADRNPIEALSRPRSARAAGSGASACRWTCSAARWRARSSRSRSRTTPAARPCPARTSPSMTCSAA